MQLNDLEAYLNRLLDTAKFHDYCPNGLQVEGRREVRQVVSGVTASLDFLEAAIAARADAVLVHHGYFWRGENPCLTVMRRRRIALLLAHFERSNSTSRLKDIPSCPRDLDLDSQ